MQRSTPDITGGALGTVLPSGMVASRMSHGARNGVQRVNPAEFTILIADDDDNIRESLSQHLEDEGYETMVASSGVEAMRRMRDKCPHLVLLDVNMPGALDGFAVLEAMTALFGPSRPPVILVTAVADAARVRDAIHRGVVDYIVKPFKLRDVTARVEKVLLGQKGTARPPAATSKAPEPAALLERVEQALRSGEDRGTAALVRLVLDLSGEVWAARTQAERDRFLAEVEQRLRSALRSSDLVVPAKGEGFVVVLPNAGEATATWTARKLLMLLATISVPGDVPAKLVANAGIVLAAGRDTDVSALLWQADAALSRARQTGSGFSVFTAQQGALSADSNRLQAELASAIAQGQLALAYQPKIHIASRGCCGVEALARWNHPQLGEIQPDQFVGIAIRAGLIGALTEWAMTAAVQQAKAWQQQGFELNVAVNLAMQSIYDERLPEALLSIVRRAGIDPQMMTCEIPDGAVSLDRVRVRTLASGLASAGFQIAIDNYGTGGSTDDDMRGLMAHEIKIDKGLVLSLLSQSQAEVVVRSTIERGHSHGLRVVGKGAENRRIFDLLAAWGCDVVQGFHISRPLEAGDVLPWLRAASYTVTKLSPGRNNMGDGS